VDERASPVADAAAIGHEQPAARIGRGMQAMDDEVKALNEAIAEDYSTHVYDPQPVQFLDAERLFGVAALFGELGRPADVLDLACGTGAQLARLATQLGGRVVGTDISPEPARIARERLAPFGERAEVICGDLLEIEPEQLGQFDLILNIGVIYVVPPAVQRRILEIIGACLRPGGVAVISYHAGSLPALRTNLHRLLYAGLDGMAPGDALAAARGRATQLAAAIAELPGADLQRAALAVVSSQSDLVFYHEVFNPCFVAMQTSAVARDLAVHGLDFAWYLSPTPEEPPATSLDRSIAADVADFTGGQYRHALFARYAQAGPCNVASPQLRWESALTRDNPGEFGAEQVFRQINGTATATLRAPASMAMLDCLAEGPLDWAGIAAYAGAALRGEGGALEPAEREAMASDARLLWRHGLLAPLYRMSAD
jgi:SAM-dependent methyltransferase